MLISIVLFQVACSLRTLYIKDQVSLGDNTLLLAFSDEKGLKQIKFIDSKNYEKFQSPPFLHDYKNLNVVNFKYIDETTRLLISKDQGLFIILLNSDTPKAVHIPCNNKNFKNCNIGDVFYLRKYGHTMARKETALILFCVLLAGNIYLRRV